MSMEQWEIETVRKATMDYMFAELDKWIKKEFSGKDNVTIDELNDVINKMEDMINP